MGKQILDYPEVTSASSDDYILLDSATEGTRRILVSDYVGLVGGDSDE